MQNLIIKILGVSYDLLINICMNTNEFKKDNSEIRSPLKAIRAKCLDCCCGQANEVKLCPCEKTCPIWPFRLGKNPYRRNNLTEEDRAMRAERMKAIGALNKRIK